MTTKDGGPVFPQPLRPADPDAPDDEQGMSLRDYFAAQAMTGYLSVLANPKLARVDNDMPQQVSELVYRIADAMLAEREK